MLLLLVTSALAGWTKNSEENGCVFYVGDVVGKYAPVRAECQWPVAPAKLQALLARNADHDDYFSTVAEARVIGPAPGGGELVYERHVASGISDREVVVHKTVEPIAGGTRYAWKRAADQSKVTGAHVNALADEGKWEVTASGEGSKVVYELLYDPGGSVPTFLVRWFQGSGTRTLVGELRAWAETH
jgi:hypothetical protein